MLYKIMYMKNILIIAIGILLILGSPSIKAQNGKGLFISAAGELPVLSLNGSNIVSQQYNIGFGYTFPKNIELLISIASGTLAENSKTSGFAYNTTSFGLGASYLYPISPDYKLGVELLGAYGEPNVVNTNLDFAIIQSGIKVQSKDFLFCVLGVRYRSFLQNNNNSLELYYGIGMRVGLKKK